MAKKKESTLINMLVALFVITAVSGGLLGLVFNLTEKKIDEETAKKNEKALHTVLPFENVRFDTITLFHEGTAYPCHIATDTNDNTVKGIAIKTSESGFGGKIELMVGISADGTITGTSVLSHSETPGLGANMTGKFKDQFVGKSPDSYHLAVTKDGGDVDAITAATITSRAFTKAIDKAFQALNDQQSQTENPNNNSASVGSPLFLFLCSLDVNRGIHRPLPYEEDDSKDMKIDESKVMRVWGNQDNEVFVNGQPTDLSALKDEAKQFMSANPDGVISLISDESTSYQQYCNLQNELGAAFMELRDELALEQFGKRFLDLDEAEANEICNAIPIRISEAEPNENITEEGGTENE